MKKRLFTAVLALVMIMTQVLSMSVTVTAGGVSEPVDDTASDIFFEEELQDVFEGSGTKEDPFKVTSYKHFAYLSQAVSEGNDFSGIYFKLMNDVDMKGQSHDPIGGRTENIYFSGHFDGNGKTVYNLGISKTSNRSAGLFGYIKNAVVRDLNVKGDIDTQVHTNYGTVVGKAVNSEIINCAVESDIIIQGSRPVSGTTLYVGGVVGYVEDGGRVINCQYNGTINLIGRGDPQNGEFVNRVALVAGGLIGRIDDTVVDTPDIATTVKNCIASGKMICESESYHIYWGGLVGVAYNGHDLGNNVPTDDYILFVNNCVAEMDIDVSKVDMSNTPDKFRGIRFGGLTAGIHHYQNAKVDNFHYAGEIKGLDNEAFIQKHTNTYNGVMHGGILALEHNVKNLITNSTTSYDTLYWTKNSEFVNCHTGIWDVSGYKADILAAIQKGGVADNYSGVADDEEEDNAVYDVWDGKMAESFDGGKGTKEDPYRITNGGHLALMSNAINYAEEHIDLGGLYFKVMNNIDMAGYAMEPIGGLFDKYYLDKYYFSGHFDGNNKIIKNLNLIYDEVNENGEVEYSSRTFMSVGLFGATKNAVIRDITIKDMTVTDGITAQTWFNFGALIGKAITTTVINCHVDSDIVVECCKPQSQVSIYAGSLIGFMQDGGTVNGATYKGTFEVHGRGDGEEGSSNRVATVVGGLIGRLDADAGNDDMLWNISNAIVDGTIQCVGTTYHMFWGGLIGVGFNGWGQSDSFTNNPRNVILRNVVVTADIDVTGADLSKTPENNSYINFAGIVTQTGLVALDCDNVHFVGEAKGIFDDKFLKPTTKYGGIVNSGRSNSIYKNVTTSMDRVTTNAEKMDSDGIVQNYENWKGQWDRSTCFVNDTSTGLNAIAGIKENIKKLSYYNDGYDPSKFDINDPFKAKDEVDTPNIVVVGGSAMAGSTIEVYLNIDNNVGFSNLLINLVYDKNVFTLEDYYNDAYGTNMQVGQDKTHIFWDNAGNYKSDILCTLVFKVADNIESGKYSIGADVVDAYDWDNKPVEITTTAAVIAVSGFIYGDVNGDKEVNGMDLIVLRQYLVGDVESVSDGADVNGDGSIDGIDVNELRKYMVGMTELGPKQEVNA